MTGPGGWTPSFWTGLQWLAYEHTGVERYRDRATGHFDRFWDRLAIGDVATHDLGFVYTLSDVAAWRLTGDEVARQDAIEAAEYLLDRFWSEPGVVPGVETDPRRE